jgi:hypothetical protein
MGTKPTRRQWTLKSAREMLGEVRTRTEKAVTELEPVLKRREASGPGPEQAELDEEVRQIVGTWVRAMEALGLEVNGLWRVDFDTGTGYFSWKWPEEALEYFRDGDEDSGSRSRIQ